jgi:ParB/RepB/Spo0J family partition protein
MARTPDAILTLDPRRVKPFADQPRKRFRGIKELAESIRVVGQVTPIIVTECKENGYDAELVDGERRLRACLLGKMPVKAVLEQDGDAADRYMRSVAANFCRQAHDAVEIMEAIQALHDAGKTYRQIAAAFGKGTGFVNQYVQLRRLAPPVLDLLKVPADGDPSAPARKRKRARLPLSVAMILVPLEQRLQLKAARVILEAKMGMAEARTYVHKLARSKGVPTRDHRSHYDRFKSVRSAVETCYHTVERYLTMPGSQVKALVSGAPEGERRTLAERLDKLCDSLLMFHDELVKGED